MVDQDCSEQLTYHFYCISISKNLNEQQKTDDEIFDVFAGRNYLKSAEVNSHCIPDRISPSLHVKGNKREACLIGYFLGFSVAMAFNYRR